MPIGGKRTSILEIQITDNDIDLFMIGVEELASRIGTPGFKQGEKKNVAKIFNALLEQIESGEAEQEIDL